MEEPVVGGSVEEGRGGGEHQEAEGVDGVGELLRCLGVLDLTTSVWKK